MYVACTPPEESASDACAVTTELPLVTGSQLRSGRLASSTHSKLATQHSTTTTRRLKLVSTSSWSTTTHMVLV